MVFWWQGKGYLVFVIWMVTMIVFGLVLAIATPLLPDQPWYWAIAFLVAAFVNWRKGTSLNSRKLTKLQPKSIRARLIYAAPHRFMSLPMETFSFVLVLAGIALALRWLPFAPST